MKFPEGKKQWDRSLCFRSSIRTNVRSINKFRRITPEIYSKSVAFNFKIETEIKLGFDAMVLHLMKF